MKAGLVFRLDPLTGNRVLRLPVVVAAMLTLGVFLVIVLETRPARTRHREQLSLETGSLAEVGERHIDVNPEMARLVHSQSLPTSPKVPAADSREVTPIAAPEAPRFSASPVAPLPEPGKSPEVPGEPPDSARFLTISTELPASRGAQGMETSASVRPSQGALVFKRQDEKDIQERDKSESDTEPGVAPGTIISAELSTGIISGEPLPVILTVKERVLYRGTVVIPAGATIIGKAIANFQAKRVFIQIQRLIIGDMEIAVQGTVTDAKGRAGLCDRYIDTARQQILPALFAGILAEIGKAFSATAAGAGKAAMPLLSTLDQAGAAVLTGTGTGLDAVAQALSERAKTAQAILIVFPGQGVRAVLERKIPLAVLMKAAGRR